MVNGVNHKVRTYPGQLSIPNPFRVVYYILFNPLFQTSGIQDSDLGLQGPNTEGCNFGINLH